MKHSKYIYPILTVVATIIAFSLVYYCMCNIPENGIGPNQSDIEYLDCLYFSVVTISSLGYGDLHPLGYSRAIAGVEVILGLVFIGIFVSRVVSAKQEETINYINTSNIAKRLTEKSMSLTNARDELIDLRDRENRKFRQINEKCFFLRKENPFYEPFKSLASMNAYINHLKKTDQVGLLEGHLEVHIHTVVELSGVVRKLITTLSLKNRNWNNKLSRYYLYNMNACSVDLYESLLPYTKFGGESGSSDTLKNSLHSNVRKISDAMSVKQA